MAWEESRKAEFGRVGRKSKGHWVNGVEEEKKNRTRQEKGIKKRKNRWKST